jgi:hypothetical protein
VKIIGPQIAIQADSAHSYAPWAPFRSSSDQLKSCIA